MKSELEFALHIVVIFAVVLVCKLVLSAGLAVAFSLLLIGVPFFYVALICGLTNRDPRQLPFYDWLLINPIVSGNALLASTLAEIVAKWLA